MSRDTTNRAKTYTFLTASGGGFRVIVFRTLRGGLRTPFLAALFFLFEDGAHQGPGDAMSFGDRAQAVAAGPIAEHRSPIDLSGPATDVPAFELGSPHAGPDTLDDQVPFEFGNRGDDDHHGAAERTAGIQIFAIAGKLDVEPIQFVENLEEVFHASRQTIAAPDQKHIELAAAGILEELIEGRAPGSDAADAVVTVFVHDFPFALPGQLAQIELLIFRMLVQGGNAEVKSGALHRSSAMAGSRCSSSTRRRCSPSR